MLKRVSTTTPSGEASWYGFELHGQKTADGGHFDMLALTAAHRSLPFGTRVMVKNKRNGKMIVVKITDRGPYVDGRIIDGDDQDAIRDPATDAGGKFDLFGVAHRCHSSGTTAVAWISILARSSTRATTCTAAIAG